MLIRRASPDDATALATVAERMFRDTFAADNDPADLETFLAGTYSTALQARELADPDLTTLVAVDPGGDIVAFAQLRAKPGPDVVSGPAPHQLWRFYVDRAHHGRGLARLLMDAVIDTARGLGARTLWLTVWERNWRARAFYVKCGFADVGSTVFVLGTAVQSDRVMARPVGDGGDRPGV
jgi:diamine N-acetyltransferase